MIPLSVESARSQRVAEPADGCCTTRPPFTREWSGDHAGVDTVRWQFRVNGAAAADQGWTRPHELQERVDLETGEVWPTDERPKTGMVVTAPYQLKNGDTCVSVEGRPVQLLYGRKVDELLPVSELSEAERRAKEILHSWGLNPRTRGVSRLDLTAALDLPDFAEQRQLMFALLAVQAPRRRAAAHWDRDGGIETFYLKGDRGKRMHERVYPEGPKHAERSNYLRWEAQTRWSGRNKKSTFEWTADLARKTFLTKFGAVGQVDETVTVTTYPRLVDELVALAQVGEIEPAELIRLSGWVALREQGGAKALISQPTVWRYEKRLRELGLASATGKQLQQKEVRVPVADYFKRLEQIRW